MLHAARALGRRVIISKGWFDDSLVENGADCISIGEVNVHALFPRVAAVVHHGGAGTTTATALAGVPQVVVPNLYDQHYWAQRVHPLGIGVAHAAGAPTTDSLASALVQSLRPEVANRARALAHSICRDGTTIAAERLLQLACGPGLPSHVSMVGCDAVGSGTEVRSWAFSRPIGDVGRCRFVAGSRATFTDSRPAIWRSSRTSGWSRSAYLFLPRVACTAI